MLKLILTSPDLKNLYWLAKILGNQKSGYFQYVTFFLYQGIFERNKKKHLQLYWLNNNQSKNNIIRARRSPGLV